MNNTRTNLQWLIAPGILPLSWAALFAVFILLYRIFDLPTPAEILPVAKHAFERYGMPVLLVAAFVECLFMISIYVPGSLVIAIAVVVAEKSLLDLTAVGFFAWIGFVLALPVNYWLGEKGFYRVLLKLGRRDVIENMQLRLERREVPTLFLTAIHPNFLAIAVVCQGIAKRGLARTTLLGAVFLVPWIALITYVLARSSEKVDVTDSNQAWYFVLALVIWALISIVARRRKAGNA